MLRGSPLDVVLLATDLDGAKDFYSNKLGLSLIDGSEQSLTFSCGDGSTVIISKSGSGTPHSQAQAQWRVQDLAAELSNLRSRGVKIEEYDDPGFKTEDGINDSGFGLYAWITDPAKNALALLQKKWRPPAESGKHHIAPGRLVWRRLDRADCWRRTTASTDRDRAAAVPARRANQSARVCRDSRRALLLPNTESHVASALETRAIAKAGVDRPSQAVALIATRRSRPGHPTRATALPGLSYIQS